MLEDKIIYAIKKYIPQATVKLTKLECSRPGYAVAVQADLFQDMPLLDQHRKVKKALEHFLHDDDLHAITIKTTF
jgi:stress-induced morphogen